MRLGTLIKNQYPDGTVRDGTPQHIAAGCSHHNSCNWCRNNRTFSSRKRAPLED